MRERSARSRPARRRLALVGLGVLAVVALVAACSQGSGDSGEGEHDLAAEVDRPADAEEVVMYSSPSCGCCTQYAAYLRSQGFAVDVRHVDDLDEVKSRFGVPDEARACHTSIMGDYVVEGHVPIEAVDRLLEERPAVDGIALADMPVGSPGMGDPQLQQEPFEILSIEGGAVAPYMTL